MSEVTWTEITEDVHAGEFDASGLAGRRFKAVFAYGVELTWQPNVFGGGPKECGIGSLLYSNIPSRVASEVISYAADYGCGLKVFVEGELPKPLASTLPAGTHLTGRLQGQWWDGRFIRVDIDGERFCQEVSRTRETGLFGAKDVTVVANMGHSFTG